VEGRTQARVRTGAGSVDGPVEAQPPQGRGAVQQAARTQTGLTASPAQPCFLAGRVRFRPCNACWATLLRQRTYGNAPTATLGTGADGRRWPVCPPAAPVCSPRNVRKQCLCTILESHSLDGNAATLHRALSNSWLLGCPQNGGSGTKDPHSHCTLKVAGTFACP